MKIKRYICIIIGFILSFSFVGCNKKNDSQATQIELWSTYNTEKILQDKTYTSEDKHKFGFDISMYRNEYESGQIVITPVDGNINSYSVELSDLKLSTDSNIVLSKNDLKLYNQKYIEVITPSSIYLGGGMYPDAILPFETAVNYRENKVKKQQNQSIWLEVHTSETQNSGIYNGQFELKIDSKVYQIPVSVTVYDGNVSAKNNLRTVFSIHKYWNEGGIATAEQDSSWEMYSAYYDFLNKYRINARYLPASRSDINGYIDCALKIIDDDTVSTFVLPYLDKYDYTLGKMSIDFDQYREVLIAFCEASINNNVNLFSKAITYFAVFDEAVTNGSVDVANLILNKVANLHNEVADIYQNKKDEENQNIDQTMIDDLRGIINLFVDRYTSELTADNATYCPLIREYHTESGRNLYDNENEKWWYTCVTPKTPYATYHIDDYLYSSRIMSWMQYCYNVTGNLYWSTTYFLKNSTSTPLQDYYDTALRFDCPNPSNGDGFLLYPGKPYGIYGPVGSIRLNSIRDGMEDYEIINELGKNYSEIYNRLNIKNSFSNVMNIMNEKLFTGTQLFTSSEIFNKQKVLLSQLVELYNGLGTALIDVEFENGSAKLKMYSPNGVSIFNGDTELNDYDSVTDGKIYYINININQNENILDLKVKNETSEKNLNIDFGAKQSVIDATNTKDNIIVNNNSNVELKDGEDISYNHKVLKLNFGVSESSFDYFIWNSQLLQNVDKENGQIEFEIYNPYSENIKYETFLKVSKQDILQNSVSGILVSGKNKIIVSLSNINFTKLGELKEIKVQLNDKPENTSRVIYIGNITLIG